MSEKSAVQQQSGLDFGVILEGLLLYPESYVNFGHYWWTLKMMLADWVEENQKADVDPEILRGSVMPPDAIDYDEGSVYYFLDQFSCKEDYLDWISYANPMVLGEDLDGEEMTIEDPEWEENFL